MLTALPPASFSARPLRRVPPPPRPERRPEPHKPHGPERPDEEARRNRRLAAWVVGGLLALWGARFVWHFWHAM